MLVLSRERDESIMIGENIAVTVVDIRGDRVRIGIDAPGEIPVHRREVHDAIRGEKCHGGNERSSWNGESRGGQPSAPPKSSGA